MSCGYCKGTGIDPENLTSKSELACPACEQWKDVEGFEGYYQVSNRGNIKTLARKDSTGRPRHERILSPSVSENKRGAKTLLIMLRKDGKNYSRSVGKLVARAFIGKSNMNAYRIDGNYRNNRAENLIYLPSQGRSLGRNQSRESHPTISIKR